jgi:hypothetical protein
MESLLHTSYFIRPKKEDEFWSIMARVKADKVWFLSSVKKLLPLSSTKKAAKSRNKMYSFNDASDITRSWITFFSIKAWTCEDVWGMGGVVLAGSDYYTIKKWSNVLYEFYIWYEVEDFDLATVKGWFRVDVYSIRRQKMTVHDFIFSMLKHYYNDCVISEMSNLSKKKVEEFQNTLDSITFNGISANWWVFDISWETEVTDTESQLTIALKHKSKPKAVLNYLENVIRNREVLAQVIKVEWIKMILKKDWKTQTVPIDTNADLREEVLIKLRADNVIYSPSINPQEFKENTIRYRDSKESLPLLWKKLSEDT